MLIPNSNAFTRIRNLVSASLQKLSDINKPRFKFFSTVFELWLGLPVRYMMLNLGRIGAYCEKSIRLHFEKLFDFVSFNAALIKKSCGKELIAAFDPSYIPKSGKQTPGLGRWWSGKDQCTLNKIGDQLPVYNRCSSRNSHVIGSGTNTIQRSIAAEKAKLRKSLCKYHKKAYAYTKTNGKIPGGRWIFYEA
jgi:hypothetical protein